MSETVDSIGRVRKIRDRARGVVYHIFSLDGGIPEAAVLNSPPGTRDAIAAAYAGGMRYAVCIENPTGRAAGKRIARLHEKLKEKRPLFEEEDV